MQTHSKHTQARARTYVPRLCVHMTKTLFKTARPYSHDNNLDRKKNERT